VRVTVGGLSVGQPNFLQQARHNTVSFIAGPTAMHTNWLGERRTHLFASD